MNVVHLMASPFLGGPERQVLGQARSLPAGYRTRFLSFAERGLAEAFLSEARRQGFEAVALRENAPHFLRAAREIAEHLRRWRADVLCCSGYKPDLIGWLAARRVGVPVVAVAHGWTAATLKVRLNEALDRLVLHGMDCTVCVSSAQAARVRRAGVPSGRMRVIRNGIDRAAFGRPDPAYRDELRAYFGRPPRFLVGAAGRLSPEKGFDLFVDAAALVRRRHDAGFVLFGDGPLRDGLAKRVARRRLEGRFILAGFRADVRHFLPFLDLAVLSSRTEGLPVAVLEALAAGVPVVATAVGGTPEVIEDGVSGRLVPPDDPPALAGRIADLLADDEARRVLGACGRRRVEDEFTFERVSRQYQELFRQLARHGTTERQGLAPGASDGKGGPVVRAPG